MNAASCIVAAHGSLVLPLHAYESRVLLALSGFRAAVFQFREAMLERFKRGSRTLDAFPV